MPHERVPHSVVDEIDDFPQGCLGERVAGDMNESKRSFMPRDRQCNNGPPVKELDMFVGEFQWKYSVEFSTLGQMASAQGVVATSSSWLMSCHKFSDTPIVAQQTVERKHFVSFSQHAVGLTGMALAYVCACTVIWRPRGVCASGFGQNSVVFPCVIQHLAVLRAASLITF